MMESINRRMVQGIIGLTILAVMVPATGHTADRRGFTLELGLGMGSTTIEDDAGGSVDGSGLAGGIYYYQLTDERGTTVKRMLLVK